MPEPVGRGADRPGTEPAPGRLVVEMLNGAPTIATSGRHDCSCSTSVRNGRCPKITIPAWANSSCSAIPGGRSRCTSFVAHAMTVPLGRDNPLAMGLVTRGRCERVTQHRRESAAWPSRRSRPRRRRCGRAPRPAHRSRPPVLRRNTVNPNVKLADPIRSHCDSNPHRIAPANRCQVIDLAVHDLHVVAGGDQTRVGHTEVVEEAGVRLVEPDEVSPLNTTPCWSTSA